jgi:hypothetical protein
MESDEIRRNFKLQQEDEKGLTWPDARCGGTNDENVGRKQRRENNLHKPTIRYEMTMKV